MSILTARRIPGVHNRLLDRGGINTQRLCELLEDMAWAIESSPLLA